MDDITTPRNARIGLAAILAPWVAAILAMAGYFALVDWANSQQCPCGSDAECMEMHGGDGSPDSGDLET